MNQQQYRQTVSSIRWTAQQRADIEARLKMPRLQQSLQHQATPDEWDDGMDDPMAAIRQSYESMKKAEEYDMKTRKIRKVMWIGIAAAILATGGAIASAVAYTKKHPRILEINWKDGTTLNLTAEEIQTPYVPLRHVNPSGSMECDLTPTGNGWYFRKNVQLESSGDFFGADRVSMLCYTDKATGQTVPVCAKPQCKHEGEEYCTATTKTYSSSYMQYYDGALYTITTKYLDPALRPSQAYLGIAGASNYSNDCHQVLLRYSPDGTEITELVDFGIGLGAAACTINRGYVWCLVQLQQVGEEIVNPITNNKSQFASGGWQIWGYELATGKSVLVYDAMGDPEVNQVNDAPNDLYAYGDYLYFNRSTNDWSGGQGLARLSLLTGEVSSGEEDTIVNGNHFICMNKTYAIRENSVTISQDKYAHEYYLIDLETREEKKITPDFDKVPEDEIALGRDCYILFMNDQYIITSNSSNYNGGKPIAQNIGIYDLDGNLVKRVDAGFQNETDSKTMKDKDGNPYERNFSEYFALTGFDGNTIYATHNIGGHEEELDARNKQYTNDIIYTIIDALLNETPNWQIAYSTTEEVRGDAE